MGRKVFLASAFLVPGAVLLVSLKWPAALWLLVVFAPLIGVGFHDIFQRTHALLRIYPVIGHGRYLFEALRPEIQQYFVESNTDEVPFSREFRTVVYQRAKGDTDTRPFGTLRDVNRIGYEWMNHSLAPRPIREKEPRLKVGGEECSQPYLASRLNISAMSFGSLSQNAILALNRGAKMAGCLHNTGEGGISPYHLQEGGDLTWQIGTGYFGCRMKDGSFDAGLFAENAQRPQVKMIEVKLSQGAKPAHGGILPAAKLSPEIARIRGVPMGQDVISPPAHTAFANPIGLLEFVARLRGLSGGKPVGFKLCIGHRTEFLGICKAMLETGLFPDFITIDGSEGGTGAAPLELSNSVGMSLRDGLTFVHNSLQGIGVRSRMRLLAAGKTITGFHIFRCLALGAEACNSARGMMFALGCIQAQRCNSNHCPVGIATQDPSRNEALNVADRAKRVARYHGATIASLLELVASAGLDDPAEVRAEHVLKRIDVGVIRNLAQVYSFIPPGALLQSSQLPEPWRSDWASASPVSWEAAHPGPLSGPVPELRPI